VNIAVESLSGFFATTVLKWNYPTSRFVRGPKPLRWLTMAGLLPLWYLGQKFAPFFDKLDRDWALETSGYFATAKKP
jgi:hypothetical protein